MSGRSTGLLHGTDISHHSHGELGFPSVGTNCNEKNQAARVTPMVAAPLKRFVLRAHVRGSEECAWVRTETPQLTTVKGRPWRTDQQEKQVRPAAHLVQRTALTEDNRYLGKVCQ